MGTLVQFLIICPLVFVAGCIDAIAGGGGLISLPAYMIAGLPVHNAIGTNKMSSCMGTTLATWRFSKKGYIPWKETIGCVIAALCGSFLGARTALLVEDRIFKIIMLVILPATGIYVLRGRSLGEEKEPYPAEKTRLIASAIALVIGVYDGFYGPGTGTFLILLLTGAAHMSLQTSNGVSKAINLATNVAALAVYLFSGKTILLLGLTAGCFSIAGNYVGTRFFEKKGAKSVKPVMIVVLSIFFIKVVNELFF